MKLEPKEEYFAQRHEALSELLKNTAKLGMGMTRLLLGALLLSGVIGTGGCLVVGHLAYNRGKTDGVDQARKEIEASKKKEHIGD